MPKIFIIQFLPIAILSVLIGCSRNTRIHKSSNFDIQADEFSTSFDLASWKRKGDKPVSTYYRLSESLDSVRKVIITYPFDISRQMIKELSSECKINILYRENARLINIKKEIADLNISLGKIEFTKCHENLNELNFICMYDSIKPYILDVKNSAFNYKKLPTSIKKVTKNIVLNTQSVLINKKTLYVDKTFFENNQQNNSLEKVRRCLIYDFSLSHLVYIPTRNIAHSLPELMRFLDKSRLLIKEVESENSESFIKELKILIEPIIEDSLKIERFKEFKLVDGTETSYANALIVNKKVFVPLYSVFSDEAALKKWKELLPYHTIIGCFVDKNQRKWQDKDNLHNRIKFIY